MFTLQDLLLPARKTDMDSFLVRHHLSQSKVSNLVVFMGLALVLILHPLEALAMSPVNRCGEILRATGLRTRLALGFGGISLGFLAIPATHAVEQYVNNRAHQMVSDSFGNSSLLQAKRERARQLGLSGAFIYRADIPTFASTFTYHDFYGLTVLEGELDRWALIFKDPHFVAIRQAWIKGQISDFKALSEAEVLIRGRTQVFNIYYSFNPSQSLTAESACHVIYGGQHSGANPIFASIPRLTSTPALQIRVAQIRYASIIETAREADANKIQQTMEQARQAESQVVSDAREGESSFPPLQTSCAPARAAAAIPGSPIHSKLPLENQH